MFNWIEATVEECAWHIAKTKSQHTTSVLTHHLRMGNTQMVDKIKEARSIAKKLRRLIEAKQIAETLTKEDYQIADYYPVTDSALDK